MPKISKKTNIYDKYKEFLPSKKFVRVISVCIGVCVLILAFASYFGSSSNFSKAPLSISKNATLSDLLVQDSNNNGIADWEETLYGLDPKADGVKNKQIIDAQKLKIRQENGITDSDTSSASSETANLSREMLSTILALKQSGNLTPEAVANLSNTLGETVDSQRDNTQTYTLNDMNVTDDTSAKALATYSKNLESALSTANSNGLGKEMALVYQMLDQTSGPDQAKQMDQYVAVYAKFASDIVAIKTPQALTQKALAVANACALMSHALARIENMYTDAVSGLIGFDEYATSYNSVQTSVPSLISSLGLGDVSSQ